LSVRQQHYEVTERHIACGPAVTQGQE